MGPLKENTEKEYCDILQQVVFAENPDSREIHLADAFELGRNSVSQLMMPPDELVSIHHAAVLRLSEEHPELSLGEVAGLLTLPLIEISMSYGMSFREQVEQRYQAIVDKRLHQSNKLEAVGTLAAGISHDFNNILGSIIGYAELIDDDLPEGSAGKRNIKHLLNASLRARDLVSRMLAFARQGESSSVIEVDAVAEIREALALVNVTEKNLTISLHTGIDRGTVMAKSGQVQQIVMNLCINAADAMDQSGEIIVFVERATAKQCGYSGGDVGICVTVSDRGHGMTPEMQERIFDPFFTTKEPGKGTGLGLSIVHSLVAELGGELTVESRASGDNCGSDFRFILPIAEHETEGSRCRRSCSRSVTKRCTGR